MTNLQITHHAVESSNLHSAGYHPESQTLAITFKSGHTYHYHGVTPNQHAAFQAAASKGSWVHTHLVKTKHAATKQ